MAGKASWKLKPPVAENTQGIVVSGFASLDLGIALFLKFPENAGGEWLADLQESYPVTAANKVGSGGNGDNASGRLDVAVSIAFTYTGLERMGLPRRALASFSTPFKEGMFQVDRLRRLGDRRKGTGSEDPETGNPWLDTTGGVCPDWSGNTPSQRQQPRVSATSVRADGGTAIDDSTSDEDVETISTDKTVHAALLVYTNANPNQLATDIEALLNRHGIGISHSLPLDNLGGKDGNPGREHFGFADGLSQPVPYDYDDEQEHKDLKCVVVRNGKDQDKSMNVQSVPLGEFLIGYKNGHQEHARGPFVDGETADKLPQAAGLQPHREAQGFYDLGINGSYLVIRQLRQHVPAFWRSMEDAAGKVREADPKSDHFTAKWLAERVVGRTVDGDVLRPSGPVKRPAEEDFEFFDDDRWGAGCPLGSHVRRANPRDSLAPDEKQKAALLKSANNHRILRRGRTYGQPIADRTQDDGQERGLLFMCLNTDIARQFEFIQQTWLFNSDFSTLFEEVDPLLGSDGWMTIPQKEGLRRRVKVETFIHMVGGEYFFLPSIPALRYLAMLPPTGSSSG